MNVPHIPRYFNEKKAAFVKADRYHSLVFLLLVNRMRSKLDFTMLTGLLVDQWAVCWQYFTGYYYQSVAWVQVGAPHNPTCEPVEITKVDA